MWDRLTHVAGGTTHKKMKYPVDKQYLTNKDETVDPKTNVQV